MATKRKKTTQAEFVAQLPIEEINKAKATKEGIKYLSNILNKLRRGYRDRMSKINKAGEFSFAEEAFKKSVPFNKPASQILPKASISARRNILVSEISKYQDFMKNRTSTVEGILETWKEQDALIFGKDENGAPLGTLTRDERKVYWDTWNAYEKEFNEDVVRQGRYKAIMQLLQNVVFTSPITELQEDTEILRDLINEKRPFMNPIGRNLSINQMMDIANEMGIELPKYFSYDQSNPQETKLRLIYRTNYLYHNKK